MIYSLYSQKKDMAVEFFDVFDADKIKAAIVKHLKTDATDTIEYCKEYPKKDIKRYYGNEIISFYAVNPKNGKVSKCVLKGEKTYYKAIE